MAKCCPGLFLVMEVVTVGGLLTSHSPPSLPEPDDDQPVPDDDQPADDYVQDDRERVATCR